MAGSESKVQKKAPPPSLSMSVMDLSDVLPEATSSLNTDAHETLSGAVTNVSDLAASDWTTADARTIMRTRMSTPFAPAERCAAAPLDPIAAMRAK